MTRNVHDFPPADPGAFEQEPVGFDWTAGLLPGEAIVTINVGINVVDGVDPSPSAHLLALPSINGLAGYPARRRARVSSISDSPNGTMFGRAVIGALGSIASSAQITLSGVVAIASGNARAFMTAAICAATTAIPDPSAFLS